RGTYGGQPFSAVFTNDDTPGGDVAWNTLPRGTTGYFVVSFYGGSGPDGTLAVGDIVNVYAIDVYTRKRSPYARNELAVFTVEAAVTEPPHEDVEIVSSCPERRTAVKIRLTRRWRGYEPGVELDHLTDAAAARLVAQGKAEDITPPPPPDPDPEVDTEVEAEAGGGDRKSGA